MSIEKFAKSDGWGAWRVTSVPLLEDGSVDPDAGQYYPALDVTFRLFQTEDGTKIKLMPEDADNFPGVGDQGLELVYFKNADVLIGDLTAGGSAGQFDYRVVFSLDADGKMPENLRCEMRAIQGREGSYAIGGPI